MNLYRNFQILYLLNHAILNLIKKLENERTFDDLPHLRQLSAVISEKRKAIAKNVMELSTISSQQLVQQVGLSHTSMYSTLCSITYPYPISIQHDLKPADTSNRAEFCWWFCRYIYVMFRCSIHSSSVMKPSSI